MRESMQESEVLMKDPKEDSSGLGPLNLYLFHHPHFTHCWGLNQDSHKSQTSTIPTELSPECPENIKLSTAFQQPLLMPHPDLPLCVLRLWVFIYPKKGIHLLACHLKHGSFHLCLAPLKFTFGGYFYVVRIH